MPKPRAEVCNVNMEQPNSEVNELKQLVKQLVNIVQLNQQPRSQARRPFSGQCFYCKETGHMRRDCPIYGYDKAAGVRNQSNSMQHQQQHQQQDQQQRQQQHHQRSNHQFNHSQLTPNQNGNSWQYRQPVHQQHSHTPTSQSAGAPYSVNMISQEDSGQPQSWPQPQTNQSILQTSGLDPKAAEYTGAEDVAPGVSLIRH